MLTLLQGLQSQFNLSTNLTSTFAGGLEVDQAKDNENLPLCVLAISPPAPATFQNAGASSPYVETIMCVFTIYATDPNTVQNTEAFLDAAYNRTSFSVAPDYLLLSIRNGGGNPYRDIDGKTWRADYAYKFVVQRFS